MADKAGTRELVLDILLNIAKQGEYSNIAVAGVLDKYQYLDKKERAFLTRLAEGTLEYQIQLDDTIGRFSSVPVHKMKPVILCILRMGVYQIRYMDAVPDAAACNESVRLAKKKGFRSLSGFVNGVLREISRNKSRISQAYQSLQDYQEFQEGRPQELERYLSVRYSIPEWMIRMWKDELCFDWDKPADMQSMERLLEAFLAPAPVTVRVNTSLCTREELEKRLLEEGVAAQCCAECEDALQITGYDHITALLSFQEGLFYVQDVSSMLAAQAAAPREGDFVLDACAAPGGKAIYAALLLHGSGSVLARDITQHKISRISENLRRCKIKNVQVQVWDARKLDPSLVEKADVVIADVPCSGLGVMRRKKDIRYNMAPEKIRELAFLQREILSAVHQYVKPGGRLIYSTCTISRQENEENAQWFLSSHTDFRLLSQRQILPQAGGGDGFYIAEFKKAPDIRSMSHQQLSSFLASLGEKPYREKQVFSWLHQKCAADFSEMTNLSADLRAKLKETARLTVLKAQEVQISSQDGTRKYLFALPDGNMVESVLMRYRHGNSVCISSQVGCRMACRFCASAIGGLVRNLEPSEMLEQVYRIHMDIGERISNVVVMGTGEPLDNYENLLRFIELLTAEEGMHISQRSLTVSTCGIVPKIRELAGQKLQITLALSLHAPTQEKRMSVMPVAAQYELSEVMEACEEYFEKTGRRMTYEYSLMHGVNDTDEDARQLCRLLAGKNCHVNLIPVNPVRERDYRQPDENTTLAFKNKLEKNKINVTIRRELGRDIDGACGQLRKKYQAKQAETV